MEFKVGDKVQFGNFTGWDGEIVYIDPSNEGLDYPIVVRMRPKVSNKTSARAYLQAASKQSLTKLDPLDQFPVGSLVCWENAAGIVHCGKVIGQSFEYPGTLVIELGTFVCYQAITGLWLKEL